ncbi:MAG TPA: SagB/ThcOx family dehydrogenase [Mesotoga sp.]|jgi:SagB-type dehydrogenase family enzyme|uniref:SagB/ThcOx family dehydrogenase n=1 Tax=unclassified Mesotoga TaxID=1184398 RepID=UPI000A5582F8|nr:MULTISPECIES: SagB/ThcOx family dehydrogenase [unclassified Mesotoga]PVD16513.1 nitroreductase [Mesotoga sp. Brook.08.105.5.1]RAO97629.1 nitroreductase [Mesotoga sp. Brook.08.YT.4.2.5.4.]RDI93205.1 nitroreductase [Mesotoga sp. Brook.08.YT.4.2.5.2.]HNU24006.1 SagB/ThcOx family dehydrogenase [Mesotoga sp.]
MMTRKEGRAFLSNKIWQEVNREMNKTDQMKGLPQPSLEKSSEGYDLISLPDPNSTHLIMKDLREIVFSRESRRVYSDEKLSLEALSFLLWSSQGVKAVMKNNYATLRTVPSAGARHPFETYIFVRLVKGLKRGLYRYVALSHSLVLEKEGDFASEVADAALGQKFVGHCAATFVWSVIPYRTEWRYDLTSYKPILLDAGHICQNLYLACEALNLGTCAIAAYDQEKIDKLIGLDGYDEFVIYMAPVGKPKRY